MEKDFEDYDLFTSASENDNTLEDNFIIDERELTKEEQDLLKSEYINNECATFIVELFNNKIKFIGEKWESAFADWNDKNCNQELKNVKMIIKQFTKHPDMLTYLTVVSALESLQDSAFFANVVRASGYAPTLSKETVNGIKNCNRFTRNDFVKLGKDEDSLDCAGADLLGVSREHIPELKKFVDEINERDNKNK